MAAASSCIYNKWCQVRVKQASMLAAAAAAAVRDNS